MPTSMTFTSLQSDLRSYLERGNVSDTTVYAQLPRLINLAERDIARELKIQGFINVVTGAMVAGTSVYQKPDRWRDTVSINFGVGAAQVRTPLFPRSYEYCRMYWPDEDVRAQPKFYADYNYYNWLFSPTPDDAYPFELLYYELPALLDDSNQTNWTTDLAPNALLHGALVQASRFLNKDDAKIKTWRDAYDRDLGLLSGENIQKVVDRSSVRQEA